MNTQIVKALANKYYERAKEIRHCLHRIPEPGFAEYKTQKFICEQLDAIGIEYRTEKTWTVGLIKGAGAGKVVGLRADIDALPIAEPEGLTYRSEHEGWMHACGHDVHTAIQLGTAMAIWEIRDRLNGAVKLFFQPAEETDGGAKPMIEAGVMEDPHVDVCYGLHVQSYLTLRDVETRVGTLNASTDEVTVEVFGKSGHAARPEKCVDAIVCAGQMISSLQTLVSRNVSPLECVVLSFGSITGGTAPNAICDHVTIKGTLRTLNPELRESSKSRIMNICESVAAAYGAKAKVTFFEGYSALINHKREAEMILDTAEELYGNDHAIMKELPSMGGEDFCYFIENTPGAFYHIGVTKPEDHPAPPLHNPGFRADEEAILHGIEMQLALCLKETNTQL